jgi:hypothetical protein
MQRFQCVGLFSRAQDLEHDPDVTCNSAATIGYKLLISKLSKVLARDKDDRNRNQQSVFLKHRLRKTNR